MPLKSFKTKPLTLGFDLRLPLWRDSYGSAFKAQARYSPLAFAG